MANEKQPEKNQPTEPDASAEKPVEPYKLPNAPVLHKALMNKKANDTKWGTSKHLAGKYYPSIAKRRAAKKQNRLNQKAGRK